MERQQQLRRWSWLIIVIIIVVALVMERWRTYSEHSQDKNILAAAQKYGVDASLIKAVVWRESRFNPRVRGKSGEIGLMQIREPAAREWAQAERIVSFSHRDLFDPAKNILAGTWYLRKMLRRYGQTDFPARYALADYNAGRSNVLRWNQGAASTNSEEFLKQMDFPGTREYVRSILKRQPKYRKEFAKREATS